MPKAIWLLRCIFAATSELGFFLQGYFDDVAPVYLSTSHFRARFLMPRGSAALRI
jgi:hypothetical protein